MRKPIKPPSTARHFLSDDGNYAMRVNHPAKDECEIEIYTIGADNKVGKDPVVDVHVQDGTVNSIAGMGLPDPRKLQKNIDRTFAEQPRRFPNGKPTFSEETWAKVDKFIKSRERAALGSQEKTHW